MNEALVTAKLAKISDDDIEQIIEALGLADFGDLLPDLIESLREMTVDQAGATVESLAGYLPKGDAYAALLEQANERAIDWAAEHAAELVTKIEETTRNELRSLLERALADGATNDDISSEISDAFLFSSERSDMIARTETAFAENQGTIEGWRATGIVEGKEWLPDAEACPICEANAEQGVIPIDEDFDSGDDSPPAHPNCECSMLAALVDDAGEEVADEGAEAAG